MPIASIARLLIPGLMVMGLSPGARAQGETLVGMDEGGGVVIQFDASGNMPHNFTPFGASFSGGVRVASGDVTGDGIDDIIVGAGPGPVSGPHVRVFDGLSGVLLFDLEPFDSGFAGGVYVAAGDVDGDGMSDIITSAGPGGGPHVRIFSGRGGVPLADFDAFPGGFNGGVYVAAGDINGDNRADVIVAPVSNMAPQVRVIDAARGEEIRSFFAFDPGFTGGVSVTGGDWNGDGRTDIIAGAGPASGAAPAPGGGPHVRVFDGVTPQLIGGFLAYDPTFIGGVRVATGDINADGRSDIITAPGAGAEPVVKFFLSPTPSAVSSFTAFGNGYSGGVFVATAVFLPVVFRDGFEP